MINRLIEIAIYVYNITITKAHEVGGSTERSFYEG